jgi:hypothetical protein
LDVTLTPVNPPIVVPAGGGSFSFNAAVVNNGPAQVPFTVWARMKYPNGTYTSPTLGPVTVNPAVGITISRLRVQNIPATYPSGAYTYLGYANLSFTYPAIDSASFPFTKSAVAGTGPMVWDAICSGEPFPGERSQTAFIPSGLELAVSPNPFNPTTAISFELQAANSIRLNVYDTSGRLVASLADGRQEAGNHRVSFDGSNLASGLYFVRLQTGDQSAVGKMMLMK